MSSNVDGVMRQCKRIGEACCVRAGRGRNRNDVAYFDGAAVRNISSRS